jgi:hypothetical protein
VHFHIRKTEFKNKITGEIKTEISLSDINDYEEVTDEEYNKNQEEIKQDIKKIVTINYLNDVGVLA